jgi:hypothetical protein
VYLASTGTHYAVSTWIEAGLRQGLYRRLLDKCDNPDLPTSGEALDNLGFEGAAPSQRV